MYNKVINLSLVAQVAKGFKELNEKMAFIGGAVISLYTDDPVAEEIRQTSDIDMTIKLANYTEMGSNARTFSRVKVLTKNIKKSTHNQKKKYRN